MPASLETIVGNLYNALVVELRERGDVSAPFSVAEIYQDLVPYRTHRDRIGAEINGDYEHALLRLLSGENDWVRVESEAAQKRIQEELESANPNTALYRDYAAVDVFLNVDRLEDAAAVASEGGTRAVEPEGREDAPALGLADSEDSEEDTPLNTRADGESGARNACGWCEGELPDREDLRFCPYCGKDVSVRPCPECEAEIESGWTFCVACGVEVGSD